MKQTIAALLTCTLIFSSCKKTEQPIPAQAQNAPTVGAFILSEGGFGANNTKLSFYNFASNSITGDYFAQQNPSISTGLGDTGNDMIQFGSKLYIVVNNSSKVTVLNASNGTFIKNIDFGTALPRYVTFARSKIYVTAYDNKVSVIDTSSLNIIKKINVGPNPEGLAATANYLYVANSGGFNTVPDSTVSVIDLNTETEIRKIKVGVNPNKVQVNKAGNILVSAYGNFGNIPASLSFIDASVNTASINLGPNFAYSNVRVAGDFAYLYNNYGSSNIVVYNTALNQIVRNNFITDGTTIQTTYAVNVDPVTADVYIGDARNYVSTGRVSCYTSAGVRKFEVSTAPGVNPNTIAFKY
jgi:YVTN family beta-propeller protein